MAKKAKKAAKRPAPASVEAPEPAPLEVLDYYHNQPVQVSGIPAVGFPGKEAQTLVHVQSGPNGDLMTADQAKQKFATDGAKIFYNIKGFGQVLPTGLTAIDVVELLSK